jgi:chromosomal replication initiator protein
VESKDIISKIIEEAENKIKEATGSACKLFMKTNIDFLSYYEIGQKIIQICAVEFGIEPSQLILSTRKRSLVEPRQISMYLIRKHTLLSLQEIGMLYMTSSPHEADRYGKDHTTIIHAIRSVENLLEYDKRFSDKFKRITDTINLILY